MKGETSESTKADVNFKLTPDVNNDPSSESMRAVLVVSCPMPMPRLRPPSAMALVYPLLRLPRRGTAQTRCEAWESQPSNSNGQCSRHPSSAS